MIHGSDLGILSFFTFLAIGQTTVPMYIIFAICKPFEPDAWFLSEH